MQNKDLNYDFKVEFCSLFKLTAMQSVCSVWTLL